LNLQDAEFEKSLQENVQLARFTTLGIGGAARFFSEARSIACLRAGVRWASERNLPLLVLGGGSNLVVSDSGFRGLVLRVAIKGIRINASGERATVTAGAGEEWDDLVSLCVASDLAGVECLSGIPGSVGATPIQNVGAYGQEISETMLSLRAIDLATGEEVEIGRDSCRFGYRSSRFKREDRNRFIITEVEYGLRINGAPAIRYAELERYLIERGISSPSLIETREAVIAIRRRKAMVIDPADADSRSVGSFFVNPVVTGDEYEEIKHRASRFVSDAEKMPAFPTQDRIKLSAAWLIERAGFEKGYARGNVGISTKHALAIVNRGGGTAREVLALAAEIKSRVRDRFGVALDIEPVMAGFDLM
jgi:UDP-N-acetylmuramate dehydrogenase